MLDEKGFGYGVCRCRVACEASTEDAKVCGHCQTPFPKQAARAEASSAPVQPAPAENAELVGEGALFDVLKKEFETAVRLDAPDARDDSDRHPNVAFFHYRNLLALAPLAKITDEAMREKLSSGVRRSLAEVTHFNEKCPACKGTREFVQKAPDVGQNIGRIGVGDRLKKKVPCPLCGAKGVIPGYRNYASMTRYFAEGRRSFDTAHQSTGDRKVGYGWLPASVADDLNVRERALVASGYGAPCPKCGWTGLESCQACKGEGFVKCKAAGCRDGFVETTKNAIGGGNTGRGGRNRGVQQQQQKEVFPCETCGGTALVRCEACAGARLQPCRKCNGEGLAPQCGRCSGTGLVNCRKCSGSGRYRRPGLKGEEEDCPDCRGLGEVNCQSCNGIGRRTGGY